MAIKLIKLTKQYQNQLIEMLDEWKRDQEENHTDTSPYAIFKNSYEDFDYYLDNLLGSSLSVVIPLYMCERTKVSHARLLTCFLTDIDEIVL